MWKYQVGGYQVGGFDELERCQGREGQYQCKKQPKDEGQRAKGK